MISANQNVPAISQADFSSFGVELIQFNEKFIPSGYHSYLIYLDSITLL